MEVKNELYYDDEVDLFELILLLWKKKTLILIITFVFALLAGGFTKFFVTPVYQTRLRLLVSDVGVISTKYGSYTTAIQTSQELADLIKTDDVLQSTIQELDNPEDHTVAGLRDSINITTDENTPNTFLVMVSDNSPEQSYNLATILYDNYMTYLNIRLGTDSLTFFKHDFQRKIDSLTLELQLNKELLAKAEQLAAEIPDSYIDSKYLSGTNLGNIVLDNIINPNKINIDNKIINYKSTINFQETNIVHYESLLTLIQSDLDQIETGNIDSLTFAQNNVTLASEPVLPVAQTSPNMLMNTAIGAVLGGMLSVFYVLAASWFVKKKKVQ